MIYRLKIIVFESYRMTHTLSLGGYSRDVMTHNPGFHPSPPNNECINRLIQAIKLLKVSSVNNPSYPPSIYLLSYRIISWKVFKRWISVSTNFVELLGLISLIFKIHLSMERTQQQCKLYQLRQISKAHKVSDRLNTPSKWNISSISLKSTKVQ